MTPPYLDVVSPTTTVPRRSITGHADPDHTAEPRLAGWSRRRRIRAVSVPLLFVAFGVLPACGSADSDGTASIALSPADVSQTVEFTATEYEFAVDAATVIEAGEVVRFRLTNIGTLDHEMRILDENGRLIDQIPRLVPGASGEVLVSFETAGRYQLICDIDDHLTRGQRAVFSINEPVAD